MFTLSSNRHNLLIMPKFTAIKFNLKPRRVQFKAVIAQKMTWKEIQKHLRERKEEKALKGLDEMNLTHTKTYPKGILKKSSYRKSV